MRDYSTNEMGFSKERNTDLTINVSTTYVRTVLYLASFHWIFLTECIVFGLTREAPQCLSPHSCAVHAVRYNFMGAPSLFILAFKQLSVFWRMIFCWNEEILATVNYTLCFPSHTQHCSKILLMRNSSRCWLVRIHIWWTRCALRRKPIGIICADCPFRQVILGSVRSVFIHTYQLLGSTLLTTKIKFSERLGQSCQFWVLSSVYLKVMSPKIHSVEIRNQKHRLMSLYEPMIIIHLLQPESKRSATLTKRSLQSHVRRVYKRCSLIIHPVVLRWILPSIQHQANDIFQDTYYWCWTGQCKAFYRQRYVAVEHHEISFAPWLCNCWTSHYLI